MGDSGAVIGQFRTMIRGCELLLRTAIHNAEKAYNLHALEIAKTDGFQSG
jgi:hypothetical protein